MTTPQTVLRLIATLVVMTFFVSACSQDKAPAQVKAPTQDNAPTQLKVYSAGMIHETNTFSPVPTDLKSFTVIRRKDITGKKGEFGAFGAPPVWRDLTLENKGTFIPGTFALTAPSAAASKEVYEHLRDELLADLKSQLPVDMVLLHLHGAMVAGGYDDPERDLIERVRKLVGPKVAIGVEMDAHNHLTDKSMAQADIAIFYKYYPHTDVGDRAKEVFNLSLATLQGKIKPVQAVFDTRMVGMFKTNPPIMAGLVNEMIEAEKQPGVLSVSFSHGFPYGDVTIESAKMLVITDDNPALAEQTAETLGMKFYEQRKEIPIATVDMETAFQEAIASKTHPVVVADTADNSGVGAPGDSTYALEWLVEHDVQNVGMCTMTDPEVAEQAKKAGVGSKIDVKLGGKLGATSGKPVEITVEVIGVKDNYTSIFPQPSGDPMYFPVGTSVALRWHTIDIIVISERIQCWAPVIFEDFGIDPEEKQILVPKSTQHFYGAFSKISDNIIYMAAPGAATLDMKALQHKNLDTSKVYPWNENPLGAK